MALYGTRITHLRVEIIVKSETPRIQIFEYEFIYEAKNENLHNGRITFYLMIFLFVLIYAFQYIYFNAAVNINIALSELYNN